MKLTQEDYDERKDRALAGQATDEDNRLVKLYEAEGYEYSGPVEEPESVDQEASEDEDETPEEDSWDGNSSEKSSGATPSGSEKTSDESLSPAPTTEQFSTSAPRASSTARSTGGSGKARK
jgi:hypothetical protein